jgi:hypothetical protein
MTRCQDPKKYFATPRAMIWHVNFRDCEGFAATFTASASWSQDGSFMSLGFGLKEFPMDLDEFIACRDAMNHAIAARKDQDAASEAAT